MSINYCKITEDLLPLYQDNLLSPETKEFVEGHLEQCPECRKKHLALASALPEDQNLTALPEEARYESARRFLLAFRRRTKVLGFVLLFGFIFFTLTSFWLGQASFTEKPLKVKSADEYAAQVVPGWSRAEQSGQIIPLNITKPIEGTQAKVTFEKVWFSGKYTIVLYTVTDPDKKYYLTSGEEIDISPERTMARNSGMHPFGNRYGGISDKGLHNIMVFLGYNNFQIGAQYPETAKGTTGSHLADDWKTIPLVLTVPQWQEGPFSPKDYKSYREISSEVSIPLELKREYLQEKTETIALNKTLQWQERQVMLEKLEIGFSHNTLYGKIKLPPGENNPSLQGYFKAGDQQAWITEQKTEPLTEPNTYEFIAITQPFNAWPVPTELHLEGLKFQTSDILTFPFPWAKYKESEERKQIEPENQAPQVCYDSTIRLWQIEKEGLSFKIDNPTAKEQPIVIEPTNYYPEITNSMGEKLEQNSGGSWSGNIFGNDDLGFGFEIDRNDPFWQSSEQVIIKISKPRAKMILKEIIPIWPR
ncbi:MAG TPA: hypothetical protein GXX46_06325 [Peptococcaceae bacterium]|nr:hypothetical protein [Peptococcaceae bacterium]